MKPTLIIISGFSCTGKTTLGKKISKQLSLPAFGRDDFQESLYNSLGYSNREWSRKLGFASYEILYLMAEKLLALGSSVVVESNFKSKKDTARLKRLKDKYHCNLLQIHCYVEIPLALTRFKDRAKSSQRHPGHVDHLIYEEIEYNFKQGGYEILDICDRTLRVDTTNFEEIDHKIIFDFIREYL